MNAKFHLCLLAFILGTIIVQGAVTGSKVKNPFHVDTKRVIEKGECSFQ